MKLYELHQDNNQIMIEDVLYGKTIDEGMIDNVVELIGGAIGFIPGAGEPADIALAIKNMVQKDWLGAIFYLISALPEPTSDLIAKSLRLIQKLIAASAGTEAKDVINVKINDVIKNKSNVISKITAIIDKIGGVEKIKQMWDNVESHLSKLNDEAKDIDGDKQSLIGKAFRFIGENSDKILEYLNKFVELIKDLLSAGSNSEPAMA